MDWLKIIGLSVVLIAFGFYSFQKGRAYERGVISIQKKEKNNNKSKQEKKQ